MKSKIKLASVFFSAIVVLLGGVASGAEEIAHVKVSVPDADYVDVPMHATIKLPERLARVPLQEIRVEVHQLSDSLQSVSVPGQLVLNDKEQVEVWWIIPHIKKRGKELWDIPHKPNITSTWIVSVPVLGHPDTEFGEEKVFSWQDKKGEYLDLLFDGQKVTRYMYAHDTSNAQRSFETYKPFHHVYDAWDNRLTNGPDGVDPYIRDQIRYPHHRGVYIGWNRLTFEGKRYDLWHMPQAHQVHQKFLEQTAGPVLARSTTLIHWNDTNDMNGKPIIVERRQTTVFRQSDPTVLLLDFHTELKAIRGDVFLNGDPEHAGFQYRPHDAVAKGGPEVKAKYLFHQDGIDPQENRSPCA